MTAVNPTHTCFDDAADLMCEAICGTPEAAFSGELILVHAICLSPTGEEFAHAWVETDGRLVWFVGVVEWERRQFAVDLKTFYTDARVKETTKYTPAEAWRENQKFETYGPWIERYQALCVELGKARRFE